MRAAAAARGRPRAAAPESLEVSSPAFADGQAIPARHSADGVGTSPALAWRLPGDAAALDQILAMGFGPNRAQRALDAAGGDAQRAIEQLLGGG